MALKTVDDEVDEVTYGEKVVCCSEVMLCGLFV